MKIIETKVAKQAELNRLKTLTDTQVIEIYRVDTLGLRQVAELSIRAHYCDSLCDQYEEQMSIDSNIIDQQGRTISSLEKIVANQGQIIEIQTKQIKSKTRLSKLLYGALAATGLIAMLK